MSAAPRIRVEDRGALRVLVLDNPSKRNALDFRALDELEAACVTAERLGARCHAHRAKIMAGT